MFVVIKNKASHGSTATLKLEGDFTTVIYQQADPSDQKVADPFQDIKATPGSIKLLTYQPLLLVNVAALTIHNLTSYMQYTFKLHVDYAQSVGVCSSYSITK
jgi:hypothetical protein